MGFLAPSAKTVTSEPEVVTVTDDDNYNAEHAYADKVSRRKGLLSTILSKSSSGTGSSSSSSISSSSSSSSSSKQSTLG